MWCLKEHEGRCIYILPGYNISFGKSLSDIKIEGDTTISRLHAVVSVDSCEESEFHHKCIIRDMSKYGTYILRDEEKKRLTKDQIFILKAGDKLQFGLKNSIFTVIYHSLIVATSSLSREEMDKLRDIMRHLGGKLLNHWDNTCIYLTVPETFLFTIKLACALASAKTIVNIAYWEAVMKAVEEMKELPKIKDFLSAVKEEWLHAGTELFLPKEERRTLFRGLSFVHFCAKQYATYAPIITAAGGKSCVYPTKKPLTPRDLTARNAVVIQQPDNDSSQFTVKVIATDYPIIHSKLSALKRRMICDSEIPLAILYCSTEKYCNPTFNFGSLLKSSTQMFPPSDIVIVEDTQDMVRASNKRKHKEQQQIIPETFDSQYNSRYISNKVHPCSGSKEKNISGDSKDGSNVVCIFSSKDNEQFRIIPETCDSSDKSIANDGFSRSSIKKSRVIPESCDRSSVGRLSAEHEHVKNVSREDVESRQGKEVILGKENNSTLAKRNLIFEKDDLLLESNNTTLEDNSLTVTRKNLTSKKSNPLESDNSVGQNDEGESSKSSKGPRVVSIEKIDNYGKSNVCIVDQMTKKTLEKGHSGIKESLDPQLRQRNKRDEAVEIIDIEEGGKEEISRKVKAKEVRIEERGVEKKKKIPRKRETDRYEQYLGYESTNKILRKDVPCGKRFVKAPIQIPARRLKSDDFVL